MAQAFIRVILNGQFWVWHGCGAGAVRARRRHGGHKGHASLKFEKNGHLTNRAISAPKLIADKNLRIGARWGMKSQKTRPTLRLRFLRGNNFLSIVVQTSFLNTLFDLYLCHDELPYPSPACAYAPHPLQRPPL